MRRTHRAQRTPDPSLIPLLVQAGAARTLGSVVIFLSIALLCLGAYVLVQVIRHPLDAQPSEIIGAAVMIALAATMLFYLLEPRGYPHLVHRRHAAQLFSGVIAAHTAPLTSQPPHTQSELPFAATSVDRSSGDASSEGD